MASPPTSGDKPLTTDQIRERADTWSLAADVSLLATLQAFSEVSASGHLLLTSVAFLDNDFRLKKYEYINQSKKKKICRCQKLNLSTRIVLGSISGQHCFCCICQLYVFRCCTADLCSVCALCAGAERLESGWGGAAGAGRPAGGLGGRPLPAADGRHSADARLQRTVRRVSRLRGRRCRPGRPGRRKTGEGSEVFRRNHQALYMRLIVTGVANS